MNFMDAIYWLLVVIGHLGIACVVFNHVHAFAAPQVGVKNRKLTEKIVGALAIVPLVLITILCIYQLRGFGIELPIWMHAYFSFCLASGIYFLLRWIYRCLTGRLPKRVLRTSQTWLDVAASSPGNIRITRKARWLGKIPGNQATRLLVEEWKFSFPKLPQDLINFRIAQISDTHLTGDLALEYFGAMVEVINQASVDLVVITGDLLDTDECLEWIDAIFGQLRSQHGVYYVLGNHDLMISDLAGYHSKLRRAGLNHAADGPLHTVAVGGQSLQIAGNERPWFGETKISIVQDKRKIEESTFRILLSHSPDQIGWAVARDVDLMFAGHTHGGQIRLPFVGPIIAPSCYGIKYASGTFQIRKTLMHVSRGISGDEPVRFNCPPEIGIFTLVRTI